MLSKNEVNFIKQLSHKKIRDELNLFIAEGEKLILDLLQSPLTLHTLYLTSQNTHPILLINSAAIIISPSYMAAISTLKTPASCFAIFNKPPVTNFIATPNTWVLALDNIQDPGNLGSIIRLADWFGIKNIICNLQTVDAFNTKTIQASMGSIARVQVVYINLQTWLQQHSKLPIYATSLQGQTMLHKKFEPGIVVIGNEGNGISNNILNLATQQIMLPCLGGAESLNAAVATGMVLTKLIY